MARAKKEREIKVSEDDSIEDVLSIFEELDKCYTAFKPKTTSIECIDSGSPALNNAICLEGYPRGRISQIYGPYGSGKSFLSLIACKNATKDWAKLSGKEKPFALWFDAEHSFNYDWAKKLDLWDDDPSKSKIRLVKGANGKDIFERLVGKMKKTDFGYKKCQQGLLDYILEGKINVPIIIIDSLASIISPREMDSPVGGLTVAALSGFLTAELKRVEGILERSNTALICLNQVRQSLDAGQYGDKFHFPGGESLKHNMSLNIYVERRTGMEDLICTDPKDRNTLIGQKVKVVVKKNRFGPTPRTCETKLLFTEGAGYDKIGIVDVEEEIIKLALSCNYISLGGSWISLPSGEKFQGSKKLQEAMKENPEITENLKAGIAAAKNDTKYFGADEVIEENEDDVEKLLENSEEDGEEV